MVEGGAKVSSKGHTTQQISHERFIERCIQRLHPRKVAEGRDRNRELEIERQSETDRWTDRETESRLCWQGPFKGYVCCIWQLAMMWLLVLSH